MRKSSNQLSLFDLPAWRNPPAFAPIHIESFGKIYALVETLGVISLHQTRASAELALDIESARRAKPKERPKP